MILMINDFNELLYLSMGFVSVNGWFWTVLPDEGPVIAQICFWAVHSSLSIRLAAFWLGLVIASFLSKLIFRWIVTFHVTLLREMVSTNLLHLIQLLKK